MRVRAERIQQLVQKLDSIADPEIRSVTRELLHAVTELHVQGLERVLETLSASDSGGSAVIDQLGDDELVGPLMALHGLHPLDLPERIVRGIDKAVAILEKHGATAELIDLQDGRVSVRLRTRGGSNAVAELEDAIYQQAPDLVSLSIEEEMTSASGFVPLEALTAATAGSVL